MIALGQVFGRWTVDRYIKSRRGRGRWECVCACGARKILLGYKLSSGNTKSCGCWRRDRLLKHGFTSRSGGRASRTREYTSWAGAKERCHNPDAQAYDRYGGRGITMCERWRVDFTAFLADMGARPTPRHTLDRIDNDGPYSPENCRWATYGEQNRNTRQNRWIEFNGETLCLQDWALRLGMSSNGLVRRLHLFPVAEALTRPVVYQAPHRRRA